VTKLPDEGTWGLNMRSRLPACSSKNRRIITVPIIVRLQGTNAEEAKKLIEESGLKVQSAILLSEAAALVGKAVA